MEEYHQLNQTKKNFTHLLYNLDVAKSECIKKYIHITNLDERYKNIEKCITKNTKSIHKDIEIFKKQYHIQSENNHVYKELDKIIKSKEEPIQQFPLSNNKEWKEIFDREYKDNKNYLLSYIYANTNLIYQQPRKIRELCLNHQTFDGEGFKADEVLQCIQNDKKII